MMAVDEQGSQRDGWHGMARYDDGRMVSFSRHGKCELDPEEPSQSKHVLCEGHLDRW